MLAEGASLFAGNTELQVSYHNGDVTLADLALGVSSITTVGVNPNTALSDQFTVTFSKSVTGIDLSDFSLALTGSVAASLASISAVDAHSYLVTVTGVSGAGTMRLDLNSADTGITSLAGEALDGGFTGQAFTLDTVSRGGNFSSDLAQLKDGETGDHHLR